MLASRNSAYKLLIVQSYPNFQREKNIYPFIDENIFFFTHIEKHVKTTVRGRIGSDLFYLSIFKRKMIMYISHEYTVYVLQEYDKNDIYVHVYT